MTPALWWLVGGVVLLVAEVLLPGVFMMWLGLAGIGTGLVVLALEPGLGWQVAAFGMFAGVSLGVGLHLRRKAHVPVLNTAQAGLVGRSARVLSAEAGALRVRIGDSDWSARLAHGTAAPAEGAVLRVVGVDGVTVIVGA